MQRHVVFPNQNWLDLPKHLIPRIVQGKNVPYLFNSTTSYLFQITYNLKKINKLKVAYRDRWSQIGYDIIVNYEYPFLPIF